MKKSIVLTILLGLVLSWTPAFAKDWKVIRVAIEGGYPPFSTVTPGGELVGFDVDIAKAIVTAAGAEYKLVMQDWDGMIPALIARKYDCIVASMSITEERKKKVAFTNKYYQIPGKFIARKGHIKEFSQKVLKGKTIGVQRSTIHDTYLTDNYGDTATIKRYGTQDELYLDLASGRIDLLICDSIAAFEGFLKKPEGKDFEFVGPDLTDPKWYGTGVGIALRKQDTDLQKILNDSIEKIRADGTYKKIQDKYFDFNIYGD